MEVRRRILMEESQTSIQWPSNGDGRYVNDNGAFGDNANTHYSSLTQIPAGKYAFTFIVEGLSPSTYRIHEYNSSGQWVAMRAKIAVSALGRHKLLFTMNGGTMRISCPKSMQKYLITKIG